MPRDEKRRQRSLQKQAAKRKAKHQAIARAQASGVGSLALQAPYWPLLECLITTDWRVEGVLTQIIVARRGPAGEIGVGVFLVDLGCLGVKDAYARIAPSDVEYHTLRDGIDTTQGLTETSLDLAAKVLREAIAYANRFGFLPAREYARAATMLRGADPDACPETIPLGQANGTPLFIAGPYDNSRHIIDQLTRVVGAGNFDVVLPEPLDDWLDEELDDEDEELDQR